MAIQLSTGDRMVKSRVQLLMHYPFFGTLALHLRLKEVHNIPTAATDGRNYFYNPKFVEKLDDAELNFLTAHEVLHPALGHLWRRGSRDPIIWNHAADYCINGMITESDPTGKDFKMIKGGLLDDKFKGMFSEEIYDILIQDEDYVKKAKQQAAQGNGGTLDSHDEWDNPQDPDDGDGGDGKDKNGGSGKLDDGKEEDWKGRIVQAAQVAEGKGRGTMPAGIKRLLKELIEPQKNWKELLAEFVQIEINDYGFTPPNRHHLWRDMILPDFTETTDVIKELVFAIDTSGSIGDREIRTFISECVGCMNQFGGKVRGWLIYCDADVAAVYELEDAEHSRPAGGGGTDFRPVFDWVEENTEDCAGVVYLTDGYGTFPAKPPHYPVLWVLTTDYEVPWGNDTRIEIR
ncbi:MAG: hypothetical protein K0R18_275 [Bacillales bacterium]|jgi:predicted metal-dependent peptidase|nr:hypothetical protein [Bacillales bacterium]